MRRKYKAHEHRDYCTDAIYESVLRCWWHFIYCVRFIGRAPNLSLCHQNVLRSAFTFWRVVVAAGNTLTAASNKLQASDKSKYIVGINNYPSYLSTKKCWTPKKRIALCKPSIMQCPIYIPCWRRFATGMWGSRIKLLCWRTPNGHAL